MDLGKKRAPHGHRAGPFLIYRNRYLPVDTSHDREVRAIRNIVVCGKAVIESEVCVVSKMKQSSSMEVNSALIRTEAVFTNFQLRDTSTTDHREWCERQLGGDASPEKEFRVIDFTQCSIVFCGIEVSDFGSDVPLARTSADPKSETVDVGEILRVVLVITVGSVDDTDLTRVRLLYRLLYSREGRFGIGTKADPILVACTAGKVNEAEKGDNNVFETGH